ncbi:MAG: methionyl-tRNA formyltransferase [Bacteroidota bacterium]|nr:methionyl-tRNA formyltransferase [Bacteroidota bacterium]MDP4229739.1 methionyl-tRNA formyltransferase [Bacteroidota bacterium]MDP4235881.1 methionyl-tRNA formyltransferase [Bacteroidota bacterium]
MTDLNTSGLRIVFFGTPEFAAYILEYLVKEGEQIVAVVTTPEKQQGRGLKSKPTVVQEAAQKLGIPVLAPEKLADPTFVTQLRALDADIFCIVAYKILPREVFSIPRLGAFNVHTSLLPKYRGAAPMNWAIMNGETRTGVTTFLLDNKVDTGNILLQAAVPIGPDETVGELHDRLMHLGAQLASETLHGLANGLLRSHPQAGIGATPAPKIFPADCIIDFSKSAEQVHNKIRGLSPFPTAIAILPNSEKLKVYRSALPGDIHIKYEAGEFRVSEDKRRLYVGTSTTPVELLEVQRENKKRMTTEEFLRGARNLFI